MKKFVALLVIATLCLSSVAALAADVKFGQWTANTTTWNQSDIFAPDGTTWKVYFSLIDSYAVGRVFYAGQNTYGSAKWTYDASAQGTWRTARDYTSGALNQQHLTWGMRKNDSYTGTVKLMGTFRP